MNRRRTPNEVETAVLIKCARRCALCFGLSHDLSEKHGQLAHVDQDPSNYSEENLAFLCILHHSLYDSRTSQHKNYTAHEVKAMRAALHDAIRRKEHSDKNIVVTAARPSDPELPFNSPVSEDSALRSSLFLLFARMYRERPDRDDVRGVYTISATFRSDYPRPIGVEFIGWRPLSEQADAFAVLKVRGLRLELPQDPSRRQPEGLGLDHLVVYPNQVFRAMLDVYFVSPDGDPVADCAGRIGTLALSVDGSESSFPLFVHYSGSKAGVPLIPQQASPRLEWPKDDTRAQGWRHYSWSIHNDTWRSPQSFYGIRASLQFSSPDGTRIFDTSGVFRIGADDPPEFRAEVDRLDPDQRVVLLAAIFFADTDPSKQMRYYAASSWPPSISPERELTTGVWICEITLTWAGGGKAISRWSLPVRNRYLIGAEAC